MLLWLNASLVISHIGSSKAHLCGNQHRNLFFQHTTYIMKSIFTVTFFVLSLLLALDKCHKWWYLWHLPCSPQMIKRFQDGPTSQDFHLQVAASSSRFISVCNACIPPPSFFTRIIMKVLTIKKLSFFINMQ